MTIRYLSISLAICLAFFSCKKKKDAPEPETKTNQVETPKKDTTIAAQKYGKGVIHLHTFDGETELDTYTDYFYVDGSEKRISMKDTKVNIFDFELVDIQGNVVKMSDTSFIKTPETISYNIYKAPVGKYKALRFKVGTKTASSGSFLAYFKGKLDTAATPDESNDRVDYEYRITSASNYVQVTLPDRRLGSEFNIAEVGFEYLHLYMDLNLLFSDIDLRNPENLKVVTVEDNAKPIATKLAANITNMFRYE